LIELRSEGKLQFRIASLYPILVRLEDRGFIAGRWVEKAGERRRRYYRLTPKGKGYLREHRAMWKQFISALTQIVGIEHA
jgi:PadR family transcriptional regulator